MEWFENLQKEQETEGGHLQLLPDAKRTASDPVVGSGRRMHCISSPRKAYFNLSFFKGWNRRRENTKWEYSSPRECTIAIQMSSLSRSLMV